MLKNEARNYFSGLENKLKNQFNLSVKYARKLGVSNETSYDYAKAVVENDNPEQFLATKQQPTSEQAREPEFKANEPTQEEPDTMLSNGELAMMMKLALEFNASVVALASTYYGNMDNIRVQKQFSKRYKELIANYTSKLKELGYE